MPGKTPRLNPLESRKRLLLAESELNRLQMVRQWQIVVEEAHALVRQARTLGFLASAAASLLSGMAALRRPRPAPAAEKPSWRRTILKGVGLISHLWTTFNPRGRGPAGN